MTESEFTASDNTQLGMCDNPKNDPIFSAEDMLSLANRMVGKCRKCKRKPTISYVDGGGATTLNCQCVYLADPDFDPITLARRFNAKNI